MHSQPIEAKAAKYLGVTDGRGGSFGDEDIKSQYVGDGFEGLCGRDWRPGLITRVKWAFGYIARVYRRMKWVVRNHVKWGLTLFKIRPWEGFGGLILVMATHLRDYIEAEERYGIAEKEYKAGKIATAREAVEILLRMKEPDGYSFRRSDAVRERYPKYKSLVTEYKDGAVSYSGNFVAQGGGWTGMESGCNPREGYFEVVNGRLEPAASPDQRETERLLAEVKRYHGELHGAYRQAEADSEADFERLFILFRDNLYSWWD